MQRHHLAALVTFLLLLPFSTCTTSSTKRGLCHIPSTAHPTDDNIWSTPRSELTWYYNYRDAPSPAYTDSRLQFIPMAWGASISNPSFLSTIEALLSSGANISHVLGFNEPDGAPDTGGSNMSPSLAASLWKTEIEPLKQHGVRLGAPAVTGSPAGFTWLEKWLAACSGGCNPDFVPVHWYGDFQGLASHVGQVMATYPALDIWITEWALPNQNLEATQQFYNLSTQWFERMENISRYAYFGAFRSDVSNIGPHSAMLTPKGQLTAIGSWYVGREATDSLPPPPANSETSQTRPLSSLVVVCAAVWMVVVLL